MNMQRRLGLTAMTLSLMASAMPVRADFWSDEGAKLDGVTIRGISESTPPSQYVSDVLAPAFTEATGVAVEFEATSWDQMYDKAIKDMEAKTGLYDFVYIEQDIIYSYLAREFLVDITKALADNPALQSETFDPAQFTSFIDNFKGEDGDLFGVPMEAFIKVYLYRTDLFDDAANQEAFSAKYGYDLAPATTHQQYRDIAEFFTQVGLDRGEELWGTTVQGNTGHPSSFYEFVETIAPTFGIYNWGINLETFGASVENGGEMNSPEAKEALTWWVENLNFAPPEATSSTWDEVAASFAAGRAAQGFVYGENAAWIATDPEKSNVVGKVGVALPPVGEGVMAAAESAEGYIGYYDGGAFGIPTSSKQQDAALLFLQFIAQEDVQADWAVASARVTHTATYEDPKVVAQDAKVSGYYTLMEDRGDLFRGAPPFPFHNAVREVAAPFIYSALTGQITPDEALDQAAAAADAELQTLGYRK